MNHFASIARPQRRLLPPLPRLGLSVSTLRRAAATLFLGGLGLAAQAGVWTSVASAGTPDEADLATTAVLFNGAYAILPATSATETVTLRYNVTNVNPQTYTYLPWLKARFLDSSATTRVLITLKAVNLATGTSRTVATLDSNAFAASASYQLQGVCGTGKFNDFDPEVYWIEATLSRSALTGSAGLAGMALEECVL